jgi:serine/threonine protein kinase/formylglycine-generating enzyme required for sulfatase activity
MPEAVSHPSQEELAAYGLGKLSADAAAAVARHLESCPRCLQLAAQAPADSFLDKVRAAGTTVSGAELPKAAAPPNVPPELAQHAKFRIVREVGRGGMGVIYLAQHLVLDKPVALKVINPSFLDHPSVLARFHAEVKAAGKLDHPNIARALDADQAGNLHFLVLEYVEGITLAQLLRQRGPLPVADACRYIHQAALGLQHAFEQGMTHRDVKPHNLMVTPQGHVKVMDFGLARLRQRQDGLGLTQTGAFMGTPAFVAPEQATDARQADTRSDVYSLGCTLYALLAGRPPFTEDSAVLLVMAHIEKEPRPLHELRPDVPEALAAVVARMMAKDPARRYQTPLDVVYALAPFTKAGPPAVPGAPAAPRPGKPLPDQETVPLAERVSDEGRVATVPTAQDSSPFRNLVEPPAAAPAKSRRRPSVGLVVTAAVSLALALLAGALIKFYKNSDGANVAKTAVAQQATRPAQRLRPRPLDCTGPTGLSAAEVHRAQEDWAKYLGRQVEETIDVARGVQMVFVLVPPGKFRMGSPEVEEDHVKDEVLHEVILTEPFDMARTEMTQAQYEALTGENPSEFKGADLPVEQVSWAEARDCAARLSKTRDDQHQYRLQTEAEWEYCCRGGRSSFKPFGVGTGDALSSAAANFDGTAPYGGAEKGINRQSTNRVGSYGANALGLYDLHGNVWEWCADWYAPYPGGDVTNPLGPTEKASQRVARGGSWLDSGWSCRAARRFGVDPGDRTSNLGFRLVRSVPGGP